MLSQFEYNYNELVKQVVNEGTDRQTRAGNTRSLFGTMLKVSSLKMGLFPILTARKIYYRPVLGELAAFVRGCEDLADFKHFGCNYWDANAEAWSGNDEVPVTHLKVGKIYGAQWRDFNGVDQLENLIHNLKHDPNSRRHLLTTYNPAELHLGCLPPCHLLAQFNVTPDHFLDCCVSMRSVDLCLGLPSDIILYATLMILLCNELDLHPGVLTFMMGDTHIYENHLKTWEEQRYAKTFELPTWQLRSLTSVTDFVPDDLNLIGYTFGERLAYPFNV
jgi:thymidylate synthase